MTVSQEMVRDYVEGINVLTNENCSIKRAINEATIRNGYLLNMLLDIYPEKKIILGLFNDATNSSDYTTSNAGMIHWKGCGKKRSYTVLTLRLLMSYIYIYGAPVLDVSRSHTTTQYSR